MNSNRPTVLFLCVHNAGRSQMAAAWLHHLAGDWVTVLSGGADPAEHINPAAVAAMAEAGIDLGTATPRRWNEDMLRSADVVITMGCGDECPLFPEKRYEDWDVAEPHGAEMDLVRTVRDDIESRVRHLVEELKTRPGSPD